MASKKKSAPKARKIVVNKSAFVRKFGVDVPATNIVEAAKKDGIELTAKHIYVIRSLDKKRAAKSLKPAAAAELAKAKNGKSKGRALPALNVPNRETNGSAPEKAFRALVTRVGLDKAKSMLADVEASL